MNTIGGEQPLARGFLTKAAPTSRHVQYQSSVLGEIGRQHTHTRHKETSIPQTNDNPLGKQDRPVVCCSACHHHAQDDQEGSCEHQSMEVSTVVQRTRYYAADKDEESLDGADPGDGRRGGVREVGLGVEGLEGSWTCVV